MEYVNCSSDKMLLSSGAETIDQGGENFLPA